jgi:hypothetical protein
MAKSWIACLGAMWLAGCGDNLFAPPDAPLARYEPWALGAVWSYKLTDRATSLVRLDASESGGLSTRRVHDPAE